MRQPESGRSSHRLPSLSGRRGALRHNWRSESTIRQNPAVNEQSLERVNAFLAAVAERTQKGELLEVTPAELREGIGLPRSIVDRARSARARRPAPTGAGRGLVPACWTTRRWLPASERRSSARVGGPRSGQRTPSRAGGAAGSAYSDMGRATVDRLVELSQEVSQLRAQLEDGTRRGSREPRDAGGGGADGPGRSPSGLGSWSTGPRWPSRT